MQVNYGPYPWYFIWSFVLGLALAAAYDLIRLVRRLTRATDCAVNISDIIFLILSAGGIFAVSYIVNNGILRSYAIAGSVLGFAIYRLIFKNRIVDFLAFAARLLCRAATRIAGIVLFPVRLAVKLIGRPLIITIGSAKQKIKSKFKTKFVKMPK